MHVGGLLKNGLKTLVVQYPELLDEVRGDGLMLGLRTHTPHIPFVEKLRTEGLLTAPAEDNVIRIVPPLVIDENHVQQALDIVQRVCAGWAQTLLRSA